MDIFGVFIMSVNEWFGNWDLTSSYLSPCNSHFTLQWNRTILYISDFLRTSELSLWINELCHCCGLGSQRLWKVLVLSVYSVDVSITNRTFYKLLGDIWLRKLCQYQEKWKFHGVESFYWPQGWWQRWVVWDTCHWKNNTDGKSESLLEALSGF